MNRNHVNLWTDLLVLGFAASCLAEWAWHAARRQPIQFPTDVFGRTA